MKRIALFVLTVAIFVPAAGQAPAQGTAAREALQHGKTEQGFPYMAGGVGSDEREQMSREARAYNLKLMFTEDMGVYLADVRVRIRDRSGKELVNVVSGGPWFFVQLPPGNYDIEASFDGKTKSIDNLRLAAGKTVSRTLRWDVPVEPATLEFARREQPAQAPAN
ncbi:MAG TPA: carboxypeptidase-like regulatory domain-containing protein [Candidatus Acidoferrales bacterium]|nr:carboxypeptidase-like regulatory domain-containing protein [Candidatus Acidoferrales bacterium]